jgi:hypothetical protein
MEDERWPVLLLHYRKLNDVMKKDCFPPTQTDDTLDTLGEAKWFSTLDLPNGSPLWTWRAVIGMWIWSRTTRRLCSRWVKGYGSSHSNLLDSAVFEWLMQTVLRGLTYASCLV